MLLNRASQVEAALAFFEKARKPIIEEYQAAARESCERWFENARHVSCISVPCSWPIADDQEHARGSARSCERVIRNSLPLTKKKFPADAKAPSLE